MSAEWHLYSFNNRRFERLFGYGTSEEEEALVAILTDKSNYDFDDPNVVRKVARRAIHEEFSYDGANAAEREVLDCIPSAVFKDSDRLTEYVDSSPESPEGLHVNVVGELLSRGKERLDLRLLPLFCEGRRYGQPRPGDCEYILFSPSEVRGLLEEVRRVVELDGRWSDPGFPGVIEKELVGPLQKVSQEGRGLAAFCP